MRNSNFLSSYPWKIPPKFQVSLSKYTSIKVGGVADVMLHISNIEELQFALSNIYKNNIPWFVLGKGSNVIFTDQGFRGIILLFKGEFQEMQIQNSYLIAGAGCSNVRCTQKARVAGFSGIEFLSTIPGTIGGAVFMNAGAHQQEVVNVLHSVKWLTKQGDIKQESVSNLQFLYRTSPFMKHQDIILEATFELKKDITDAIKKREQSMQYARKLTQPVDKPTWGSVFINPKGYYAGQLIEECGLKGKHFGNACISAKHANFIENKGGATFKDIFAAIQHAQDSVFKKHHIQLKLEVRIIDEYGKLYENT